MAYYDKLIAEWPSLNPGTTAQKVAQINSITQSVPLPANVPVRQVIDAIDATDMVAITSSQMAIIQLYLSRPGDYVNLSSGSAALSVFGTIFGGKTTAANLTTIIAPFLNATQPWWQANGYPKPIEVGDATLAGLV